MLLRDIIKNWREIFAWSTPWCGPCKNFAPIFDDVSEQHDDIVFGKINTEEQQELGAYFNIRSIPTLMILREKIALYSNAGAVPKGAFEEIIAKARALDMDEVMTSSISSALALAIISSNAPLGTAPAFE